jgi:two-component system sensor histidine kinase HydH
VGVAAPVEEVSGLVERLQQDQALIILAFFLVLVGMSSLLIVAAYSWNQALNQEVTEKTKELKRSQDRLLRSERFAAVGQAASYVSHEIKNPLMVIGGFAQQLKRNPDMPPAAVTKLEIISEEVKRLENFLGELRDFSRPAAPVKQEADLNELVRQVVMMMQDAAKDQNIQIMMQLADPLPLVPFDVNQMKQVLINLLKNAMEAMENGGTIIVTTASDDSQVMVAVQDNGKGIDPDILPNIFNPFFTTKKTGTGLGLAVINKIIEDHHGSITVASTPSQGTTFTVALPRQT